MIPYILASQHALMHLTGFIMCLSCSKGVDDAQLDHAFDIMMWSHITCFALHAAIQAIYLYCESNEDECSDESDESSICGKARFWSYIRKVLMLIKTLLFFSVIVYVQQVVLTMYDPNYIDPGSENPDSEKFAKKDQRVVWLLYEVLIFYFNIASLMIFLVFSRFLSFRTLRENNGFGLNMRRTMDFLSYCKDDLHWFQILTSQILLGFFAFFKRINLD